VQVACLIENLARCIVQSVLIAVTNVRFHSNLILADQSIVEIVGQKEDEQVVSVTRRLCERIFFNLFYFPHFLNSKNCNHQRFSVWCARKLLSDRSVTSWIKVIR
jgi:hypothetical protein